MLTAITKQTVLQVYDTKLINHVVPRCSNVPIHP